GAGAEGTGGGGEAEHAGEQVHVELLRDWGEVALAQRRCGEPASEMDRSPQRVYSAIKPLNRRFISQRSGDCHYGLRTIAIAKARGLRFIETRHVTNRTGFDQSPDDRAAK